MSFSDNYHLRNYFLNSENVPTQSLIRKEMGTHLADIYFNSMNPQLKVLAGLEPQLQGAGSVWYMPPKDLLQSKAVMKPAKPKHLADLSWTGIDKIGQKLFIKVHEYMFDKKEDILFEHAIFWKTKIEEAQLKQQLESASEEETNIIKSINVAFNEFSILYITNLKKIEGVLRDAAHEEIRMIREQVWRKLQCKYEMLLKKQSSVLNEKYDKKISIKVASLKSVFTEKLERMSNETAQRVHDLYVDKHMTVEKLRKYLECQKLACQIYVALKEKEIVKEMEQSKREHNNTIKSLSNEILLRDFEIHVARQRETKTQTFNKAWQCKICHIIRTFQKFVSYSLKTLPEYAEYFINIEKLILLQLSEALENPSVESIFVQDVEPFHTPIPRPRPFYLFCDKSYKPKINEDLCPKHCTSSANEMPVIVINKRCIYAACDNFQQFTVKVKDYVDGRRGEDADFVDYHDYTRNVPVKYTASQQLKDLKLESSLLQILQQERSNINELPIECGNCKMPNCFDCDLSTSTSNQKSVETKIQPAAIQSKPLDLLTNEISALEAELTHERQPKWDSYMRYVKSKKCDCAKLTTKNLLDCLPVYMRKMSIYEPPQLLNYEKCSVAKLQSLVKEARGLETPVAPNVPSKTKVVGTQCSDYEYDRLCTCFSDNSIKIFINEIHNNWCELRGSMKTGDQLQVVGDKLSSTYLSKQDKSFAMDRALSLRRLIDQVPEIKEAFMNKDCKYF